VADLRGGVDVEGGAVLGGESGEVGCVAVQGAAAVGEGTGCGRLGGGIVFRQAWCPEAMLWSVWRRPLV
jgi:hypothetical protein